MAVSALHLRIMRLPRSSFTVAKQRLAPNRPIGLQYARAPVSTVRAGDAPEGYTLRPMAGETELSTERTWLATALTTWLDEEWTVLPEHKDLGRAAADAYVGLRRRGEDDMGSLVLAIASELQRPDLAPAFRASFTDPFEVSNKLCETVMLRDGCDVCCTSEADRERIQRVNALLGGGGAPP